MTFARKLSDCNLDATPDSIVDIINERARELGDKTYINFIDDSEILTYREAADRAACIGRGLLEIGVKHHDKLGLLISGCKAYVLAWFGALNASIVDVPINPSFHGEVLDHAIHKIHVTAIFADLEGLQALASIPHSTLTRIALVVVPDAIFEIAMRNGLVPQGIGQFVALRELEQAGQASNLDLPEIDSKALSSIRFSSGTTGLPKGVMMDHGHMLASARKFNEMMDSGAQETMYTCFPFHHVFATVTGVLASVCAGGTLIVAKKFSATRYWKDIRENGVTRAHLLDPLVPLLMKQPASELDRQHLVPMMYTAAGYYPEFEERFGVRIISLYDMSELTVVAHYPDNVERRPGSCGMLSGLFDVKIADDEGIALPDGSEGEILVRPRHPSLMFLGYYNDAEQTVTRWRDLWFQTGDRGRKGTDGYFYFLGRSGDRIRRRGVNISAEQVEKIALTHPAILECAAIAVPSPFGEDDIKLCVRLVQDANTEPLEIGDALLEALPKALTVRYVEVLENLPKTQTEKIQRAALRAMGDRGLTPTTWDHEDRRYLAELGNEQHAT